MLHTNQKLFFLIIFTILSIQSKSAEITQESTIAGKGSAFTQLQQILPHKLINETAYIIAENETPWLKDWLINHFISTNGIDMSEAIYREAKDYASFNDFFTRQLKAGARPLPEDKTLIVSPVDGHISQIGQIQEQVLIQAKQHDYSLSNLFAEKTDLAKSFDNGVFITLYLSPKDYHRVHMPISGKLTQMIYVPGSFYSVNKETTENVENLYAQNERVIIIFDTEIGKMAMVMVGAMVVGSMETTWEGEVKSKNNEIEYYDYTNRSISIDRGQEVGLFKLGSTVIVLFPQNTAKWLDALSPTKSIQMGEPLAERVNLNSKN